MGRQCGAGLGFTLPPRSLRAEAERTLKDPGHEVVSRMWFAALGEGAVLPTARLAAAHNREIRPAAIGMWDDLSRR
jgi:hypothetical protein